MMDLFTMNGQNSAIQIFGQGGMEQEEGLESRPEIYQGTEPTCAIRCQQIILRDFGVDLPQEYLADLATQNGWYIDHVGTPMDAIGNILESQGVGVHTQENATVYDLINELGQGRRVIVSVDAGELWAVREDDVHAQLVEDFEDSINSQGADHALIVAGIEVNPDNPDDVKVILTDPGTGDLRLEYPLNEFIDAWQDSNCYMVATDQPAPYQYNPDSGLMEPSNFAVDDALADNTFELSDDDLVLPVDNEYPMDVDDFDVPADYSAYYDSGHLNYIPFDLSVINYQFPPIYDPWLAYYSNSLLNLDWNDWTYAYNMAMVDGTFNIQPFMTHVMVVFVPVPTDPVPAIPVEMIPENPEWEDTNIDNDNDNDDSEIDIADE